jgi:hypothetical protein
MKLLSRLIKFIIGIRKGDSYQYEGMTFTYNGKYWSLTDIGYKTAHPYRKLSTNLNNT